MAGAWEHFGGVGATDFVRTTSSGDAERSSGSRRHGPGRDKADGGRKRGWGLSYQAVEMR